MSARSVFVAFVLALTPCAARALAHANAQDPAPAPAPQDTPPKPVENPPAPSEKPPVENPPSEKPPEPKPQEQPPAPAPETPAPKPADGATNGGGAPVVVAGKEDPLKLPPAPVTQPIAAPPGSASPGSASPGSGPASVNAGAQGAGDPALPPTTSLVPERVTPPEGSAPPVWDGRAPATPEALTSLLAAFENAYRGSFRYRSLGRSRAGRDVWLASITRSAVADAAQIPAVLCAPRADLPAQASLEDALNQCAALLDAQTRDAALAARLSTSAVHWLLAPQPERAFPASGEPPTALDFPAGWSVAGAPRPHPLFDPESRAVASFALGAPAIGAFARAGDGAQSFAPLADAAQLAGGSLERFVSEYLGARVFDLPGATQSRTESRNAAAQRLTQLLAALPQLGVSTPRAERLREDVWLFDVPITNSGRIATLEGAAAERERSSVWMQLPADSGVSLAAVACSRGDGLPFEPLAQGAGEHAGRTGLGHLAPGRSMTLRIVVRGAEGGRTSLQLRSLRAGSIDVPLELK